MSKYLASFRVFRNRSRSVEPGSLVKNVRSVFMSYDLLCVKYPTQKSARLDTPRVASRRCSMLSKIHGIFPSLRWHEGMSLRNFCVVLSCPESTINWTKTQDY